MVLRVMRVYEGFEGNKSLTSLLKRTVQRNWLTDSKYDIYGVHVMQKGANCVVLYTFVRTPYRRIQ